MHMNENANSTYVAPLEDSGEEGHYRFYKQIAGDVSRRHDAFYQRRIARQDGRAANIPAA